MEPEQSSQVLERARAELARGKQWRARLRLASYVASGPYLPEALSLLGRVCFQMGDWPEAGRYWLLSDAEGMEVERAVALFVSLHPGGPRRLVAQLPRRTRLASADAYPPAARRRLRALDLEAALAERAWTSPATGGRFSGYPWGCLMALGVVGGGVLLVLYGLVALVRTLLG